jgi:hypothetical protein
MARRRCANARSGIFSITHAAQFALHLSAPALGRGASGKPRYETFQLHQVREPKQRASATQDDLRIGGGEVGPLRWYRADRLLIDLQQQPLAIAVVPLTHAEQQQPALRMERMRYSNKTRRDG